jgi:MFS family permease
LGDTRHHLRNTTFLGFVEAFWGLGMNLLSMGTVLPVFLQERGASNAVIAFLPALSALGAGVFQAFSGILGGHRGSLKPLVLWLHVAAPLPLFLAGFSLLWGGLPAVPIILVLWGCYYAAIGLLYPVWMDYMAKILDPSKRGRALGIVFLTQTVAGAAGATAAAALLRGGTSDGRYAVLFFVAAAAMSGGSFFFMGTRERTSESTEAASVRQHFHDLAGLWRRHRWLKAYLCTRWMVRGTYPLLVHFFAVYAVAFKGVTPASAALLGTGALLCQAMAGVAAGALGDRAGHKVSVLLGQGLLLASCTLAVLPVPGWAFFIVAGLSGAFLATEYTNQAAWLMDLASDNERQSILALVGFLLTPASVLTPLAGGWLMDRVGFRPVVAGVAVIVAAAMALAALALPAKKEVREEVMK